MAGIGIGEMALRSPVFGASTFTSFTVIACASFRSGRRDLRSRLMAPCDVLQLCGMTIGTSCR